MKDQQIKLARIITLLSHLTLQRVEIISCLKREYLIVQLIEKMGALCGFAACHCFVVF